MKYHGGSGCMPPEVARGYAKPCGCLATVPLEVTGGKVSWSGQAIPQVTPKEGKTLHKSEVVIPIESLREDLPPIELTIHGSADPELKAIIERAVRRGMEKAAKGESGQ